MIWVGLVLIFVGFVINDIVSDSHPGIYIGTLLACLGAILFSASNYESKPSAMDVYQGKTTLEITYKDGVPIDTVVVFKNEEK